MPYLLLLQRAGQAHKVLESELPGILQQMVGDASQVAKTDHPNHIFCPIDSL